MLSLPNLRIEKLDSSLQKTPLIVFELGMNDSSREYEALCRGITVLTSHILGDEDIAGISYREKSTWYFQNS